MLINFETKVKLGRALIKRTQRGRCARNRKRNMGGTSAIGGNGRQERTLFGNWVEIGLVATIKILFLEKKREKYPANNILENDNENERLSRTMKIS